MSMLSERERRDWLRLARTQNVGPVTFTALLDRFGSATAALEAVPKLAKRGGASNFHVPSAGEAEDEIAGLSKLGGRLIASCEPEFPLGLSTLDPPPPIVSVIGQVPLVAREMVAIVGARNASALGRKFAAGLAGELGRAGLVIASGMARGIDAAAHEAALSTGTCAVLAGGIDVVYPSENAGLYARLCAEGAVISEMPLRESPQARHFPRRNRIISGLSRGVVVVEAAESSGSLITANYALEQGREVFAVPGSPLDPRARGANRLIREGATLTETAEDVLAVVRPILGRAFAEPDTSPPGRVLVEWDDRQGDRLRRTILELLAPSPIDVDELIRQCEEEPATVITVLLELELAGRAKRHPGNRVSIA